jgi:hypothetical protein
MHAPLVLKFFGQLARRPKPQRRHHLPPLRAIQQIQRNDAS